MLIVRSWALLLGFACSCTVGNVNFSPDDGDDTGMPPGDTGNDDGDMMPPGDVERLNVAFETLELGDVYAPQNIVAIWIENDAGDFIETIGRWAGVRAQHLVSWAEASGQDMDAVSGATRINHEGELEATWNIGADVPDGIYLSLIHI